MFGLINIKDIKLVLGYKDNRAIKRWLNCRGIALMRLGKSYCVPESSFNDVIEKIAQSSAANSIKQEKYRPQGKNEKAYLSRLAKTISNV